MNLSLEDIDLGRVLFDEARSAILLVRPTGELVDANPASQVATGYRADELRSMTIADLCDPDDRELFARNLGLAQTADRLFDARLRKRDGKTVAVEVCARGTSVGGERLAVCLLRDAEERQRGKRDRELAAIIRTSDDAIVSKTLDGIVTSWNPAAERLYGWTAEEMVGQSITKIVPDERLDELADILDRLRRGERIEHHETVRLARDGRRIDVSLSVSPITDERGRVIGAAKIARDVTERRRLERQKREFLLLAAHELRTPLTALKVSSQLLHRRGTYDEQLVGWILNRVEHLGHLIDGLVDIARFDSGPLLRSAQVDLTALASETAFAAQQRTTRHTLRVDAPADPVLGRWDRDRIEQVIENLLDNALAYTPGGDVVVRVERRGDVARLTVTDEGPGVPAELAPSLFDRFVRLQSPGMNHVPGLGLGLHFSRTLVEAHGGRIWLEPTADRGATFVVELPLAGAEDSPSAISGPGSHTTDTTPASAREIA